jgi:c(7)-type cytochrome triheme protein
MLTCWNPRKARRIERRLAPLKIACLVLLTANFTGAGQIYLPRPPPEPPDYGKVILRADSTPAGKAVVFDHWLHRSKFTCRVCHVDVGFAMQANGTGIRAQSNREGFHCGACHDGSRVFEGKALFAAACSEEKSGQECDRCHSAGKKDARKYEYKEFTAKFPKGVYGVDWEVAENSGAIKPADFVEGISVRKAEMKGREDFGMKKEFSFVTPVGFSHQKHTVWNGCELCHPEIFPTAKKETVQYSMLLNIEGRYCGACHGKVAFPLNNCHKCHEGAPLWAAS